MTINDDGPNAIAFLHSATDKEMVPKQGTEVRLLDGYVYLEYGGGPQNSKKKVKLDYTKVTDPVVVSASALYDALQTMINN